MSAFGAVSVTFAIGRAFGVDHGQNRARDAQTHFILSRIEEALHEVGAEMRHVMRVRAYLTDLTEAGGFIRAHGEVFKGIDPVLTGVEAGLTQDGMMVEIDIDAIVHDEDGVIAG